MDLTGQPAYPTLPPLVAGRDYPGSYREFVEMFADDAACARYLESLRWPTGFTCRACGVAAEPWRQSRGRLLSRSCRSHTTLTSGTILDKTRTPLTTWFEAAWHVTTAKNGMSAKTLERTLGVRYRVAWSMLQRFRVAMVRSEGVEALTDYPPFWFFERYRGFTAQEIRAMLNLVTPIQETRAYQSIFAEGKASTLKRQLTRRFGSLPTWAEQRIDAANIEQLDAWLDGIFDAESVTALVGHEQEWRPAVSTHRLGPAPALGLLGGAGVSRRRRAA